MDLYLKIDFPQGRRLRLWKDNTRREYEKGYENVLFLPSEPTEVPDGIGKRFLKQEPHLLDVNPHPNYNNVPEDDLPSGPEVEAALKELAEIEDFQSLKANDLREYAKTLGLTFPVGTKKTEWAAMLEQRCAELAESLAVE